MGDVQDVSAPGGLDGPPGRAPAARRWSLAPDAFRLDRVVAFCLLATLAFSMVAALLMMLRYFRPLPVVAGTALLTALLFRGWVKAVRREDPRRALGGRSRGLRAVLALLLAGSAVSGLVFSAEHVETDRDPGVYVNAGRTLAEHGTLLVNPAVGGFRGSEVDPLERDEDDPLIFTSAGYYGHGHRLGLPEDQLYPRFFHALSAFLAAGQWIGGPSLLVRMNAFLGALALLMVFAFGARLTRPWLALAATAALGVNLTQVYFQRDAFTEILTQVFLFGGLWALWEASRHRTLDRGLIAGLVLGATCLVRVDSFLYLAPIGAGLLVHLLRSARRSPDRYLRHRQFVLAVVAGMLFTAGLGLLQGLLLSPLYVLEFWRPLLTLGVLLPIAIALVGWVLLRNRARLRGLGRLYRARRRLFAVAAVTAVLGGVALLYVRPVVSLREMVPPVGDPWSAFVDGFPRGPGDPLPPGTPGWFSMWWLGWYLGPIGLVAAVVGWARSWWETLMGRASRMLPFLLVFSGTTLAYLWRPTITPDHVWAMRRFLPLALPGAFLLVFWLVGQLWGDARTRGPAWRALPIVLGAGTLLFSSWTLASVPTAHGQRTLDATERLCEQLPDGSGVLVAHDDQLFLRLPQTIRGFCGVAAAYTPRGLEPHEYRDLADRWAAQGGGLYVLSPNPHALDLDELDQRFEAVVSASYEKLARRFLGRPSSIETQRIDLYLAPL